VSVRAQQFKRIEKALGGTQSLTTDATTSVRMGRVRQHGTAPELLVRHALSARGLRYRTRNRDLPGSPDIANRTHLWAVFVHGCYWHRHEGCHKATTPHSNVHFWTAKFERNVLRDRQACAGLRKLGFRVLTIWECEAESAERLTRLVTAFGKALDKDHRALVDHVVRR
jgi:DNA mismatch endonuclease, patch repair protein